MQGVLGPTLLKRDGSKANTASTLSSKRLTLVYYSASWCGPCRQFSPILSAFYKAHSASLGIELVFASLDKSEEAFKAYWATMEGGAPYAVPYGRGEELAATFKVNAVPSLHVLCDGILVTAAGVEGLSRGGAAAFPWAPFGGDLIGRKVALSGLVAAAHLNGKEGLCVGAVESSKRFSIRVPGQEELAAIKRENLAVVVFGSDLLGKAVRISGLEAEASKHLNGKQGKVVGADEATGRFSVQVEGESAAVAVKRTKLEVVA
jgi:thiol-disulfide isomerase/thioredoxin